MATRKDLIDSQQELSDVEFFLKADAIVSMHGGRLQLHYRDDSYEPRQIEDLRRHYTAQGLADFPAVDLSALKEASLVYASAVAFSTFAVKQLSEIVMIMIDWHNVQISIRHPNVKEVQINRSKRSAEPTYRVVMIDHQELGSTASANPEARDQETTAASGHVKKIHEMGRGRLGRLLSALFKRAGAKAR